MLKDNIKNSKNYTNLPDRVKVGLKYLAEADFCHMENGKYPISDDEIFAIIQDYLSKPIEEGKFEAHKKYIDIQYIIKGEEQIGVDNINNFTDSTPYDDQKDIIFLTPKDKDSASYIKLKENDFAIFMPQDAHKPSLSIKNSSYVKKAVIKVLI